MSIKLGQSELERLNAFIDGELPPQEAQQVHQLIDSDPAWADAHRQLSASGAAMDLVQVPPVRAGLADEIVARTQDIEQLSAFIDGELSPQESLRMRRLIDSDPAFAQAHRQLTAVNAAMDLVQVPAVRAGLADEIVAKAQAHGRMSPVVRVIRLLVPLAAAAAIVVVAMVAYPKFFKATTPDSNTRVVTMEQKDRDPGQKAIQAALASVPQEDQFVVENLDVFRDYDVLDNYETLQAIDKLDAPQGT